MWIVWDDEQGLVCTTGDYEEALKVYERCKESAKEYARSNGEFTGEEDIILAKVDKRFHSYDTLKPVIKEDENGETIETDDTYWDWDEITSEKNGFKCEECGIEFEVKVSKDVVIDEPICPVCSSDNVRDLE